MIAKIAALIATLDETGGSPESMLYIFFDMNMDVYSKVRSILISEGLISITGHYVTLTVKGKAQAQRINAAIKH